MLNRSTIAISVDSFIRVQIFSEPTGAAEPHSRTEAVFRRPSQLSAANVQHESRRTAPFPNGDVTTVSQVSTCVFPLVVLARPTH
jgi:hypothetical protein